MDEDTLDLIARLNAIEYLLGVAICYGHINARHTPEQIRMLHEQIVQGLQTQSLATTRDPALSDI
jgi:hypothetical protein